MMLSFLAGFISFILLFLAKWALSTMILKRKNILFWLFVMFFCETTLFLGLFMFFKKHQVHGIQILSGFLVALSLMIGYFVLVFYRKKDKEQL